MRHRPGPLNLITDVPGLLVGNAEDERAATGVTAVLCGDGWPAGVDVRGGGPGVRESEALAPENLVGRAHAIVISGGSVFGLAAADGAVALLSSHGRGLQLKPGSPPIPIVPGAVLHDLANGGDKAWRVDPPYRRLGMAAVEAAGERFDLGSAGAGRGAMVAMVKGGLGSASLDLGGGLFVGAVAAANAVGSALMPDGETFWAWPFEIEGEFGGRPPPARMDVSDPAPDETRLSQLGRLQPGAATTLAVVATSAALTTAECKRLAMMAQDGLARAIRPAHTPFDGDVVFAVSTEAISLSTGQDRAVQLARIGSAAADCLARAIARGVYEANQPHQAAAGS
ncbi:MAG TPA: P1 family peptidase [Caulobacteraceae bacterium]|jgi:L-aminopeptidase/D-esterase-like protein